MEELEFELLYVDVPSLCDLSSCLGGICSVLGMGQTVVPALRVGTDLEWPHQGSVRKHALEEVAFIQDVNRQGRFGN